MEKCREEDVSCAIRIKTHGRIPYITVQIVQDNSAFALNHFSKIFIPTSNG